MKFREFIKSSHLKTWDGIVVVFLILVSFLPIVVFGLQQTTVNASETQAVLRVDGKEIHTFKLYEGQKSYTFKYTDSDGDYNLIEVDGNRIRIKDANCGDLICVRRGWASKNGDTIVCLPHKLVIEVQALDGGDTGELDY